MVVITLQRGHTSVVAVDEHAVGRATIADRYTSRTIAFVIDPGELESRRWGHIALAAGTT